MSSISEHIKGMGQVVSGGVATATGSGTAGAAYAVSHGMTIEQAIQYATLAASVMTFLYFGVSTAYAGWKWYKEAKNGTAK